MGACCSKPEVQQGRAIDRAKTPGVKDDHRVAALRHSHSCVVGDGGGGGGVACGVLQRARGEVGPQRCAPATSVDGGSPVTRHRYQPWVRRSLRELEAQCQSRERAAVGDPVHPRCCTISHRPTTQLFESLHALTHAFRIWPSRRPFSASPSRP